MRRTYQDSALSYAAEEWAAARRAFLALPPNHPGARAALQRLADAEDNLMKAIEA